MLSRERKLLAMWSHRVHDVTSGTGLLLVLHKLADRHVSPRLEEVILDVMPVATFQQCSSRFAGGISCAMAAQAGSKADTPADHVNDLIFKGKALLQKAMSEGTKAFGQLKEALNKARSQPRDTVPERVATKVEEATEKAAKTAESAAAGMSEAATTATDGAAQATERAKQALQAEL
jgi:hypothetical protein